MKKVEAVLSLIILAGLFTPAQAQARECELPHERLQAKCGGEYPDTPSENEEAVSGVQKTGSNPQGVVNAYRERSQRSTEMVDQAVAEYKAYLNSKKR